MNSIIPDDEDGLVHFEYVDAGSTECVLFMGCVVWDDQSEPDFSREKLVANTEALIGKAARALLAMGVLPAKNPSTSSGAHDGGEG